VSTFITRYSTNGTGVRLAVKDLIDMEGEVTTAGCRAVAEKATPAAADAACMAGARSGGARIVGRTNLHELALGVTGVNPWFGTPPNPFDPALVPGGSSSGSATAVAADDADVGYGTDTGGSVRIPAACCGVAGLKTTFGRIPVDGVMPLSPTFDTVGPIARDVAGLVTGMQLLEPGFAVGSVGSVGPVRVGRIRIDADPSITTAIDGVLAATEWDVIDLDLGGWDQVNAAAGLLLVAEAWTCDGELLEQNPGKVGGDVAERLRIGRDITDQARSEAVAARQTWTRTLEATFRQVDFVVTPTLTIFPPRIDEGEKLLMGRCTLPANFAGVPALALPVPTVATVHGGGHVPASIQLIGPHHSEERLLAAGAVVEAAAATL